MTIDAEVFRVSVDMPFAIAVVRSSRAELLSISLGQKPECDSGELPSVLVEARRQLRAYLNDPRWGFDLPLEKGGTDFQRKVWAALFAIPPEQTKTYGQLAAELGSGPRAVAQACRANGFPIIVPCHRVVATKGLGGYAGHIDGPWLNFKRWLLEHEGARFA